jgi:hypothetical protein
MQAASCPQATDITVQASGGTLTATVGQPVSWIFNVHSFMYSDRQFRIYRITVPTGQPSTMMINNSMSPPTVNWTPSSRDPQTGSMTFSVRDMTRCAALESISTNCNNFTQQLPTYDQDTSQNWMLNGSTGGSGALAQMLPIITSLFGLGGGSGGGLGGTLGQLFNPSGGTTVPNTVTATNTVTTTTATQAN